ncbi:MAG: FAD-dependent oxidoreductase [Brevundimonas sp.]|uniref:FAD-dependent 5-carboxymethylaminomethyl-2-thiouridine(34) oxidoreductase MnmC n=1 Tax=Brevundimonas sp. TaxID=1871086 RepID=UPI00120B2C9A|nr:FAD-dependent 5-carboxymethylaminomethyl-2-thiouridine(34) oxidoreductase MnmC [Brevundimonas sp.]RZJ19566.1 MAG: FAD-dependent oxidoreductase [Brevundimonas sp.]
MTASDDASPQLVWADDGSPRSGRFGDVYFSKDDGLAETRAVFLQGCGLPEAWAGRDRFTVAELGFGTGLNIIALIDLWRRHRPAGGELHVFSVEGFPLTADDARRALAAWPEVAEVAEALLAVWPPSTPGFHRIDLPTFGVTLDLVIGEVEWALSQWDGAADAWFLDGFSPALNPAMWSPQVMALVAARSAPDARLATFTVAGFVRRALADQGFTVEKRPGHGRKRERLEARRGGAPRLLLRRRIAVVGAGIAGAAAVRALTADGHEVVLIEQDRPGAGASGFPASLVTPRLDAGDAVIAGLHAQALERAGRLYRDVPGAIVAQGVLQLEQAPRDAARFAKVAAQDIWTDGAMTTLDAVACAERLGESAHTGGLFMRDALAIQAAPVLQAWLAGTASRLSAEVARLERLDAGWRLLDAQDALIAEVEVVVIAAGWGSAVLADLGLSPVRGQADWVEGVTAQPVAWGGYAAPTPSGLLFGATHDRDQTDCDPRPEDSERNRQTLRARLPDLAARIDGAVAHSRAAVRATTPDRLPLAGQLQDGLFVLTGLGSRGFCLAPLLGEHVAAMISAAPSPLPRDFADRLRPDRHMPLRNQR